MVDTLITIGIIAFVLLRAYRKSQKKAQQHSQRKPINSPFPQPTVVTEPVWEEMAEEESGYEEEEVSSSYEEIPKNQPYFTYETFEPEIKSDEVVVRNRMSPQGPFHRCCMAVVSSCREVFG